MNTPAIIAFLGIGFASPGFAVASPAYAAPPADSDARAPGPVHYDFEDDQVEGNIQRPDGELISSIPKAKEESLIEIRKNFVPEIMKMIEDI
jgi:hypothetical protein